MPLDISLARPAAEAVKVEDLLDAAARGELRVPRFQRPLKWRADDVRALFDSIVRGYPIGTLLFWRRAAEAENLKLGPLRIAAGPLHGARWVVDGQQRITSLAGVLLRADDEGDDPFALWYDFDARELRTRGERPPVGARWLPLRVLGDLDRLLGWMAGEPSEERRATAKRLAKAIREYAVPTYTVESDDERVVRDIFDRMNTRGVAMAAEDVFNAIHGGSSGEPADLRELATRLGALGFGAIEERWILKVVAAVAGKDLSRGLDELVRTHPDLGDALPRTERALQRAIAFLRDDAGIPHVRLLPYRLPLLALARFFDRFPEPAPRTRVLLARWLWRGAFFEAHGDNAGPRVRDTVNAVDGDEHVAVAGLLDSLGWEPPSAVPLLEQTVAVLEQPWNARAAGSRIAAQALLALRPRDLGTGALLDVAAVLEAHGPDAFHVVLPDASDRVYGRMLHPPRPGLARALAAADDAVLASHGLRREELSAPFPAAVEGRRHRLATALTRALSYRLGLGDTDRPALGALRIADDA